MGRKINKGRGNQIVIKSVSEVKAAMEFEAKRLGNELGLMGSMRTVEPSYAWNFLASWFFEKSERARNLIMKEGKEIFDAHLASDKQVSFGQAPLPIYTPPPGERRPNPRVVKGHAGRRHPGNDGSEGEESVVVPDERPHRRS